MATAHRSFALSISLAAMLAGTVPALSAELKDPLSPLMSVTNAILLKARADEILLGCRRLSQPEDDGVPLKVE